LSIPSQVKEMRQFAAARGWEIVRVIEDEGESGRTDNRDGFQRIIALTKQSPDSFDALLVWKFSRFFRNVEKSRIYKSYLKKHGIKVISLSEPIDESPMGNLMEGIIELLDEFYSLNLAEDTLRGMRENAERGFHNGGTIPVGYRAHRVMEQGAERTQLVLDPVYAPIVQRIFRLCAEGKGAKEIVNLLNREGLTTRSGKPWTKGNVLYILKNETYTGTVVWNRTHKQDDEVIRRPDQHPALVSRAIFTQIQEQIRQRSPKVTHPRAVESPFLLSGLVYCAKCGKRMVGSAAKSSRYFYYACQSYQKRGKHVCDMKPYPQAELEVLVLNHLIEDLYTEANITRLVRLVREELAAEHSQHGDKMATVDQQLADAQGRLDRLLDALETGQFAHDVLSRRMADAQRKIDELTATRERLLRASATETALHLPATEADVRRYAQALLLLLTSGSVEARRALIRLCVIRIEVDTEGNRTRFLYRLPAPARLSEADAPLSIEQIEALYGAKKKSEPRVNAVLSIEQGGSPFERRCEPLSAER